MTYARNQVWQDPVTLWQDVVNKSPRLYRGYDNLGAAYLAIGDYQKAEENIFKALSFRSYPEIWRSYNNLGLVYLETGRYDEAWQQFERALGANPHCPQVLSNLGVVFLNQGKWDQAEASFQEALRREPRLVQPRLNLGNLAERRGDIRAARQFYQEALAVDSREVRALAPLAKLCLRLGDNPEALRYAKQFLKEGRNVEDLVSLGSRVAEKNFGNLAVALFTRAVEVDPKYLEAYVEMGKVFGNREDFDRAIAVWQSGGRQAPGDPRFDLLIQQANVLKAQP